MSKDDAIAGKQSNVEVSIDQVVNISHRLNAIEFDSWKQQQQQSQSCEQYLLANLLEIRLSFQHFRCETFANYLAEPETTTNLTPTTTTPSISANRCLPRSATYDAHSSSSINPFYLETDFVVDQRPSSPHSDQISFRIHSSPPPPKDQQKKRFVARQSSKNHNQTTTTTVRSFNSKDFRILFAKLFSHFKKSKSLDSIRPAVARGRCHESTTSDDANRAAAAKVALCDNEFRLTPSPTTVSVTECEIVPPPPPSPPTPPFVRNTRLKLAIDPAVDQSVRCEKKRNSRELEFPVAPCSTRNKKVLSAKPHSSSTASSATNLKAASHHIVDIQLDCITKNTHPVNHSSSFSFSDVSSASLRKDVACVISSSHSSNYKPPNQFLDFRSISEYAFTCESAQIESAHTAPTVTNAIGDNVDVYSLPTCINNDHENSRIRRNNNMLHNQYTSSATGTTAAESTRRVPSYVSISRAISGYSNYNKYSSDRKIDTDMLLSDILLRPMAPNVATARMRTKRNDEDQIDNYCSLPYEPTQEKVYTPTLIADDGVTNKSFVQKKIESLYGETFAEDWRKARKLKCNTTTKPITDKSRSPSCPPYRRDDTTEVSTLIKSFQKIHSLNNDSASGDSKSSRHTSSARPQSQPSVGIACEISTKQDANWFLNELYRCCGQLREHIAKYEDTLKNVDAIPEEAVGKIRSTIGKANLLINKKMNQFEQLCRESMTQPSDQAFKINTDDLEGFWDMVMIQVGEITRSFAQLDRLKANSWQEATDEKDSAQITVAKKSTVNQNTTASPHSMSKIVASSKSPNKKSDPAGSPNGIDRENERKTRLMEIKRQGKMKSREMADEEIAIFVSPSSNKEKSIDS